MRECPACKGRGYLMAPMPVSDGCGGVEYDPSPTPCSTCDGSGEYRNPHAPCDQCEAVMIQGVFCHETGCPNRTRPRQWRAEELGMSREELNAPAPGFNQQNVQNP